MDYYMHLSFDVVKQDGFGVGAPFCEEGNTDVVDGYFVLLHKSAFLTIPIADFFFSPLLFDAFRRCTSNYSIVHEYDYMV